MKEERRKALHIIAVIAVALLMAIPVSMAAATADGNVSGTSISHETGITLNVNGYTVGPDMSGIPADLKIDGYTYGRGHYILVFDAPVTQKMKNEVEAAGADIIAPMGGQKFIVEISDSDLPSVKALPHVAGVVIDQPAFRLSRLLDDANGPVNVKIYTFPGYDRAVVSKLGKMMLKDDNVWITSITPGGDIAVDQLTIVNREYGMVTATVYPQMLSQIAKINGVYYVEMDHENWLFNDKSHSQIQNTHTDTTSVGAPDTLAAGQSDATHTPVWNHGIYGEDVVIGETDTAVGPHHDMMRDPDNPYTNSDIPTNTYMPNQRKVVMYATYESTGYDHNFSDDSPDHGSHVAGTILGYDNPVGGSSAYDGMAPGAKLSFGDIDKPEGGTDAHTGAQDYLNVPSDYTEMWDPLMTGDLSMVRICSHSWGGHYQDSSGNVIEQPNYVDDNVIIDQYQWENDKLFSWAAGNEGSDTHTIGIQAESKNTVTVAAADRADDMASFSSRGPTFDNRLKPDVTMAGTSIYSVDAKKGDDKYVSEQGTSMATPGVAGALGLIQEYYNKGYYPSGSMTTANEMTPSAALMKATLINGAEEMTGSGTGTAYNGNGGYPGVDQGWGFINVDKSLYFGSTDSRKVRVWDNHFGLSTGDDVALKFDISGTSTPLTVTLVWTDPPAAMGADTALVNDLDLTVVSPGGAEYKGNVFSGANPGYSNSSGENYDRLNNVEGVKVISGHGLATGTWEVRISGYNIPVDPQPFAIVVSGDLNLDAGIVYLDNKVYSETATAHITVEDEDGGSSVNVTVTSAMTGDSETVSCTGGNAKFGGSISFTLDSPVTGDGVLSVKNGDTVTVTYNDGGFTSTATAIIDAQAPMITNVGVKYKTNVMATIGFDTNEMSLAAIKYGTTPDNLTQTDFTDTYSTSLEVSINGLQEDTLYYYDVIAKDRVGHETVDTNGGDHYTFTTDKLGDILLVISDNTGFDWQHMIDQYSDAFQDGGWNYNIWYGWTQGTPDLATLQKYKVVAWQVGIEHYAPFDDDERALVKDYLDGGGRMWVNSHDVAWALSDTTNSDWATTDTQNWLKSVMKESWKQDKDFTDMEGVSGDPISGSYTSGVSYDRYRDGGSGDDVSSQNSGGTTTYVWYDSTNSENCGVKWVSSGDNGTSGTGVWGGTPSRIVVDNFEWSAMDSRSTTHSAIRSDVLDKTLVWLIAHDHPDVTVTNPSAGDTITTDTLDIQWTKTTYGGYGVYQTKLYYSDNNGDSWYLITTLGDVTSYSWDISSVANGVNYNILIEVYDDSSAHVMGSNTSGVFTIARSGGDNDGPVIVAGSQTVEPIPIDYGSTMWINATADDGNKGGSNIQSVEFYIDSTSGTATSMNPVDGLFDSMKEDVTWSGTCDYGNGDHVVYIRAQDDAGNWGEFVNVTFHVNGAPSGVSVNVVSGWNLISFPWMSTPENITSALSAFSWERAMVYQNGHWYTYNTNRASKYNLDFPQVDNKMGIWVYATASGTDTDTGNGSTNISMSVGWNLVGYPSSNSDTVSNALSTFTGSYDMVSRYDTSSGQTVAMAASDNMEPGNGYWIHVTSAGTWTVNW